MKSLNVGPRKCGTALKHNIKWLDKSMKIQPIPHQYDYYKPISERALMELESKTILYINKHIRSDNGPWSLSLGRLFINTHACSSYFCR